MRTVVVGGGIVGLASAYYLAENGADVIVCEQRNVGAGSTERAAGGIRAQFSTRVNIELSLASIDVWETFEQQFDTGIAYRRSGYLWLAREPTTVEQFREAVALQNSLGVESELLTPTDAVNVCPELDPSHFKAATFCPTDGFADPHLALDGYKRAAIDAGVDIRTETTVTDLQLADGAVVGVETDDGEIAADSVVNAAGPWAKRIASMAAIDVPVSPRRRQLAVVEPSKPVPDDVPLTVDLDTGSYFRPERDGNALVGGHFSDQDPPVSPDDFDADFDIQWAATAVERAAEYTGYFGPDTRIRQGWAGLYAVTPDDHPIIEESKPGFVNAIGFSGHGFMHAPATGQIVADLVIDGESTVTDISPLSSDRFDGETIVEQNVV